MQVISDFNVWRTANLLLELHGRDAALVAAQRTDELLASGDVAGQLAWKRVLKALSELARDKPRGNERVN